MTLVVSFHLLLFPNLLIKSKRHSDNFRDGMNVGNPQSDRGGRGSQSRTSLRQVCAHHIARLTDVHATLCGALCFWKRKLRLPEVKLCPMVC